LDCPEVFFGCIGSAITETEIVFRGPSPVGVTLEEEALAGILFEVVLGGLEFCTLLGF
jgi:hypothetical protein